MPHSNPSFGDPSAPRQAAPGSDELTGKHRPLAPTRDDRTPGLDDTSTPEGVPAVNPLSGPPAIPGYDIVGELGRGGMGVVYKAYHVPTKRFVALKMVVPGTESSESLLRRFRSETEAVSRLSHPNIIHILEVGDFDGWPFLALEMCGGGTLAKKMSGHPMHGSAAAALVEKLARAIAAAHQQQIIHRDLKPANILLMQDGEPKISDFGLAKRIDSDDGRHSSNDPQRANSVLGTPSYMPPEQADGTARHLGPAADIYSLGAILYECLTGRPPFRGASLLDTLEQIRHQEPIPPKMFERKIPTELETICLKCLEKNPARRYASAAALADDLKRFLKGEAISARPAGWLTNLWRWRRRRPGAAAALFLLFLLMAGLLIGAAFLIADLDQSRRDAGRQADEAKKTTDR